MKGFIYKLYSEKGPEYYIGSTEMTLEKRKTYHIKMYEFLKDVNENKLAYSRILFKNYGTNEIKIELLEVIEYTTEKELRKREQYYLDLHKLDKNCVNRNRAYRDPNLKKMYKKEDNARFYKSTALNRKLQYNNLKFLKYLPYYRVNILF